MAKTISEEEIKLRKSARRRLIGAAVLVIAAIVVLPMVLDSEPKQGSHEIDIRIPSENSAGEFSPKIISEARVPAIAAAEEPEAIAQQAAQTEQVKSQSLPQPAQTTGKSVEKPVENKSDSKTESRVEKSVAATGAFVVQLGAFSDPVKARQQQQNLISNGINTYMENINTDKGEVIRVRIGPFPIRGAAEEMREKLKKLGLDGVVTAQ